MALNQTKKEKAEQTKFARLTKLTTADESTCINAQVNQEVDEKINYRKRTGNWLNRNQAEGLESFRYD